MREYTSFKKYIRVLILLLGLIFLYMIFINNNILVNAKSNMVIRPATLNVDLENDKGFKMYKETVNVRILNKEGQTITLKGPQVRGYSTSQPKISFTYHNGKLESPVPFTLQYDGHDIYDGSGVFRKNKGLSSNIKGAKVNFHGHKKLLMNMNKNLKFSKNKPSQPNIVPFDFHFNTRRITYRLINVQPYYKKAFDIAVKRFNKENKVIKLIPTSSQNALANIKYKYSDNLNGETDPDYKYDNSDNISSVNIINKCINMKDEKFHQLNGFPDISTSFCIISEIIGMKSTGKLSNKYSSDVEDCISDYMGTSTHLSKLDIKSIQKAYKDVQ